jgi:tRNA pseudouridine55 synthase
MEINKEDDIFAINKPKGISSFQAIRIIRSALKIKKIGHAGTLDPLASGILVILVGKATKRQQEFLKQEKEYIAEICLGATSRTDDAEGPIIQCTSSQDVQLNIGEVKTVINNFIGEIEQIPPIYSAVKISGRRAYKLARAGKSPELKPKKINIKEIKIIKYKWPVLEIKVVCSSGTYIRSLARDIGEKLSVGGYLQNLVRTRSGEFNIKNSISLENLVK